MQDLIPQQRAAGIEAFALVHGIPGVTEMPKDDPSWLRRIPVLRELAFVPIAPTARRELARAIADFRPDYLHVHLPNITPLLIFTLPAARRLPMVIHWHSDVVASDHSRVLRWFYPIYQPYERLLLEHADLVIATSEAYLRSSLALNTVREKCAVVPLGIPLQAHVGNGEAEIPAGPDSLPWVSGKLRLLSIGRLTYYKGHDTLVRAMSYCPEAQLLIVGEGDHAPALQRLIAELGLEERVKLLGYVEDHHKQGLLASADVFCLSSRERTEAFGLALLEAMQYSLPVIVSLIPGSGVGWVGRHQHNALAVPIDDPIAWRDAIMALAKHPELRRKLGQAGRQRLERLFDIAQVERRLFQVIQATLDPDASLPEAHEKPLFVIPARDEVATIADVVLGIQRQGYQDILVVDDGSQDNTGEVARQAGAMVIRPPLPLGAWGAMQLGIRYAVRHNYTAVVTMDADGQHRPQELPQLFTAARTDNVIIGACPARGSRARKIAWALFRVLTGFKLSDLTSGFRLYDRQACLALSSLEGSLLDYQDIGVLLLLRKNRLSVSEIAVEMAPRQAGKSRVFPNWWAVASYMWQTCLLSVLRR